MEVNWKPIILANEQQISAHNPKIAARYETAAKIVILVSCALVIGLTALPHFVTSIPQWAPAVALLGTGLVTWYVYSRQLIPRAIYHREPHQVNLTFNDFAKSKTLPMHVNDPASIAEDSPATIKRRFDALGIDFTPPAKRIAAGHPSLPFRKWAKEINVAKLALMTGEGLTPLEIVIPQIEHALFLPPRLNLYNNLYDKALWFHQCFSDILSLPQRNTGCSSIQLEEQILEMQATLETYNFLCCKVFSRLWNCPNISRSKLREGDLYQLVRHVLSKNQATRLTIWRAWAREFSITTSDLQEGNFDQLLERLLAIETPDTPALWSQWADQLNLDKEELEENDLLQLGTISLKIRARAISQRPINREALQARSTVHESYIRTQAWEWLMRLSEQKQDWIAANTFEPNSETEQLLHISLCKFLMSYEGTLANVAAAYRENIESRLTEEKFNIQLGIYASECLALLSDNQRTWIIHNTPEIQTAEDLLNCICLSIFVMNYEGDLTNITQAYNAAQTFRLQAMLDTLAKVDVRTKDSKAERHYTYYMQLHKKAVNLTSQVGELVSATPYPFYAGESAERLEVEILKQHLYIKQLEQALETNWIAEKERLLGLLASKDAPNLKAQLEALEKPALGELPQLLVKLGKLATLVNKKVLEKSCYERIQAAFHAIGHFFQLLREIFGGLPSRLRYQPLKISLEERYRRLYDHTVYLHKFTDAELPEKAEEITHDAYQTLETHLRTIENNPDVRKERLLSALDQAQRGQELAQSVAANEEKKAIAIQALTAIEAQRSALNQNSARLEEINDSLGARKIKWNHTVSVIDTKALVKQKIAHNKTTILRINFFIERIGIHLISVTALLIAAALIPNPWVQLGVIVGVFALQGVSYLIRRRISAIETSQVALRLELHSMGDRDIDRISGSLKREAPASKPDALEVQRVTSKFDLEQSSGNRLISRIMVGQGALQLDAKRLR